MKYFKKVALVFTIGCLLGMLGAWVDHQDALSTYAASVSTSNVFHTEVYPFWEWLTTPPALPGMVVAIIQYPWDWVIDEQWDYRWTITLGNGAAWAFIYCVFWAGRSLVKLARSRLFSKITDG